MLLRRKAGDALVPCIAQAVQAQIDTVQPGFLQRRQLRRQQSAVGGQGHLADAGHSLEPGGQLRYAGAQQRLAAGQPQGIDAAGGKQLHQMQQLCIGKLLRRQRGRLLRAAIAAAQVAALGQREPQAMDITVCLIIHSFGLLAPRLRGCFYACRMKKAPVRLADRGFSINPR